MRSRKWSRDVLFDEPVAVVAPDDGIGEIEILDHGLELTAVAFGDLAAEDHRELGGPADRAVGIQQADLEVRMAGIGNAWHIPKNPQPPGQASMRFPLEGIEADTPVILSNGNQFKGQGTTGNQTQSGSALLIRKAGETTFKPLPMQFQSTSLNDKFFFSTIPANTFQAGTWSIITSRLTIPTGRQHSCTAATADHLPLPTKRRLRRTLSRLRSVSRWQQRAVPLFRFRPSPGPHLSELRAYRAGRPRPGGHATCQHHCIRAACR